MSTVHTGEPTPAGPNDRPLDPGEIVGEYTIRDQLGRGGFGTVYRAVHPVIGKVVAIKVLARRLSADDAMVQRFVDEARAVNQIRHRNIIDIFSFGQLPDGRHYYVMEYLDGTPLDQYLKENGPLSLADALPMLRAIARALDAAHAQGIAHRDLKPENIVLGFDEDGRPVPKLLDFGIAKLSHKADDVPHRTATGAPIGTPYYMSPEQCRGRGVDYRTDIYAFGVMCFRLFTGEYPFDGDVIDILYKHMHEAPPLVSSKNAALERSVDAAVGAMLAKDPADRPATVLAAVSALGGEATPTPNRLSLRDSRPARSDADAMMAPTLDASSAPSLVDPPRRSRRSMWVALGALVVAIGATIAVISMRGSDEPAKHAALVVDAAVAIDAAAATIDAPPAPPSQVMIELTGIPEGLDVKQGATSIGLTPKVTVAYGTSRVVLTVMPPAGFLPLQVEVIPDRDQKQSLELEKKKKKAAGAKPHGKDDIFRLDQLPDKAAD